MASNADIVLSGFDRLSEFEREEFLRQLAKLRPDALNEGYLAKAIYPINVGPVPPQAKKCPCCGRPF